MSETCIVCLGDLGESANDPPHPVAPDHQSDDMGESLLRRSPQPPLHPNISLVEMIAHLLPCGHNLHDECLKPWVERANSCPICRQSFNLVELSKTIGGTSEGIRFLVMLID